MNLPLCFEKKKKLNPTIPYSLINTPSIIKHAAQKSFSFRINRKLPIIRAAISPFVCEFMMQVYS